LSLYLIPAVIYRGISAPQIQITIVMILFLVVSRVFVSYGYAKIVSGTLITVAWLFIQYILLFFENGLRAPAYTAALLFLIVYVGLIHRRRSVFIITALSLITSASVWILEMRGVYLSEPHMPEATWTLIAQVIFFPAVAYMVARTLYHQRLSVELYMEENKARLRSEEQVRSINRELQLAYESTLEGWARALEMHNKETVGHSRRVTELAMRLGRQLNLGPEQIQQIRFGALLHDIGKMGIPNSILNKPGPLSTEERSLIEMHPTYAFELLKGIEYLKQAIAIPHYHHENWDGSGYPHGLAAESIPLSARIFAIVDNWDALTSERPYRKAWSHEDTLAYLREQTGLKFDPNLIPDFLTILREPDKS